mmetsp:Transcript_32014/g.41156  ORF Transcript_32014/g.41156 Transcript_32014/m.41156 type:complete len:615 (+) Transcript_32014:56-1900(+)
MQSRTKFLLTRNVRRVCQGETHTKRFMTSQEDGGLINKFNRLIKNGILQDDPNQKIVLQRLSHLQDILKNFNPIQKDLKTIPQLPKSLKSYEFSDCDMSEEAKQWRIDKEKDRIRYDHSVKDIEKTIEEVLQMTPRGMYIWGDVGTGKSMLMDLFIETCPLADMDSDDALSSHSRRKRRVHFHQFMLEIHKRLHLKRQSRLLETSQASDSESSPLQAVAADMAKETLLFAFDEFQVTDVSDALILGQIFEELWKHGVIIVMTSNRPPEDLYQIGFNKTFFNRFMNYLSHRCYIQHLKTIGVDYRMLSTKQIQKGSYQINQSYDKNIHENNDNQKHQNKILDIKNNLNYDFKELLYYLLYFETLDHKVSKDGVHMDDFASNKNPFSGYQIPVMMNRVITIKRGIPFHSSLYQTHKTNNNIDADKVDHNVSMSASSNSTTSQKDEGVCWFSFEELCSSDIGAADYKTLCVFFHTIIIENIPILKEKDHNMARRFVTLIDELYEHQIRVIVSAETSPELLFQTSNNNDNNHNKKANDIKPDKKEVLKNTLHVEDFTAVKGSKQVSKSEIVSVKDLGFAFKRASSRLIEMSGQTYHQTHALTWPMARPLPTTDHIFKK